MQIQTAICNVNRQLRKAQLGQAMVEYAILLILMVMLVAGGIELGVTAFHSKKTSDAAEAGANAWAQAVSFSISNPTTLTEQTTQEFEQLTEREREGLNIDTSLFSDDGFSYSDNTFYPNRHCGSIPIPATDACVYTIDQNGHDIADITLPSSIDSDEIRPFLPVGCNVTTTSVSYTNYIPFFNSDLPIDITACDQTKSGFNTNIRRLISDSNNEITFELFPLLNYRELDPYQDFLEICTSRDNPDGIEKIVSCRALQDTRTARATTGVDIYNSPSLSNNESIVQASCTIGSPPCPDGLDDAPTSGVNGVDDNDISFRRLLVLKELKNSERYKSATSALLPVELGIKTNVNPLGEKRYRLGNHNPTRTDFPFRRPSCSATINGNPNDYDNGLPNDGRIYLFNPLPIDVTNCNGTDNLRAGRSRISVLTTGYSGDNNHTDGQDLNVNGLPAINQATYSQYSKVCVVTSGNQISIARNGSAIVGLDNCVNQGGYVWLKPPGLMCGSNGGTEVCPTEGDLNGATGFYFFGDGNTAGAFQYTPSSAASPYFRPTFQLVCEGATHQSNLYDADDGLNGIGVCDDNVVNKGAGAFRLQVNVRYRSIFESFLTFGVRELTNASLVQYFYNPNGVGTSNALVGASGSEIGPLGRNGRPSVKQFKDFRGCYQVEITAPQNVGDQIKTSVSSCN